MPGYVKSITNQEERDMLLGSVTSQAGKRLTICEQIRFIYDSVAQMEDGELKDDITEKLIDAIAMGKKMNSRLRILTRKYVDPNGHHGQSLIKLNNNLLRKKMRAQREEQNRAS